MGGGCCCRTSEAVSRVEGSGGFFGAVGEKEASETDGMWHAEVFPFSSCCFFFFFY